MSGGRPLDAHILGGPPGPVKLRAGGVQGLGLRAACQVWPSLGSPVSLWGYSVPGFPSSLPLWRVAVASADSGALLESPLGLLRLLSHLRVPAPSGLGVVCEVLMGQRATSWSLPPRFRVRRVDVCF